MVTLAVSAALLWGVGNFSMGFSARASSARGAVVIGFAMGSTLAFAFLAIQGPSASTGAVLCGACAGAAQGFGWMLFARALTLGRMAVIAPVAAMTTVVLLLAYTAFEGSAPSDWQFTGVLLCLLAVVFLSRRSGSDESASGGAVGTALAGGAGLLFALQAVFLARAPAHATSLVMVAAGVGVLGVLALTALARPIRLPSGKAVALASGGGAALFIGDAAFIFALQRGNAAVVTSIGQLHPLATALAAAMLIRERPTLAQAVGLGLASAGVLAISR